MKKAFIFVMFFVLVLPVFSQFRSTEWGDTKSDVKNAEGTPSKETETQLNYFRELSGFPVYVRYEFKNGKLESSSYIFTTNYSSSKNRYLRDFDFFQEKLKNKYGDPFVDTINWLNDTHKNNRNLWGLAISKGHLEYISIWDTNTTRILHSLIGMSGNIQHIIMYGSLKALENNSNSSNDEL